MTFLHSFGDKYNKQPIKHNRMNRNMYMMMAMMMQMMFASVVSCT